MVISLTRNVSVSLINLLKVFPITKYFIFSVENIEERHCILTKANQVP